MEHMRECYGYVLQQCAHEIKKCDRIAMDNFEFQLADRRFVAARKNLAAIDCKLALGALT